MHAVQRLYFERQRRSTKPFNARGKQVDRCPLCQVAKRNCICDTVQATKANAGFVLLMYDAEILKPSNTGRLIADVVADCHAFIWQRTSQETELLNLLADPQWQPMVVFPSEYALDEQPVFINKLPATTNKRPLFILLDGSWREAKKMYRKSVYLHSLPLVSFDFESLDSMIAGFSSRYQIRQASKSQQLATAEVAAQMLALANDHYHAQLLDLWFDFFGYRYQQSVCQTNKGRPDAQERLIDFIKKHGVR